MSRIPYGRQTIDEADIAAVVDVLRGDWLTTGPAVDQFEEALQGVTGSETVVVNSGTAALQAAYYAAGVGPGDRVVTSPMTFVATAAAAVHLGAEVLFADVRDDTLNLDADAVSAGLDERVKAIAPVDFAGHPADIRAFVELGEPYGSVVIQDGSHSLGASRDGVAVGSMADLTTFSFHPVKTITTGEGGAVSAVRLEHTRAVRRYRNQGLIRDPEHLRNSSEGAWYQEVHELGFNFRMTDIQAALGRSQIDKLGSFIKARQVLVERYVAGLSGIDGLRLPTVLEGVESAWHLFVVRVADGRRRALFEYLRECDIWAQVHYLPVHLHPAFTDMGYRRGMCPVAETAYEQMLSLPLFPALTHDDQDRVIEEVQRFLGD